MGERARYLAYPEPPLTDGVVGLRRWERRDLPCVRAAATDARITEHTTVPAAFTDAEGLAFIDRQWARQSEGAGLSLAIERTATGDAVGLIVLLFRWQPAVVGLGYWVIPEQRGQGFARRAITLLAPWALRLGLVNRVEALVEPHNLASSRSLEAAGFTKEGLLRSYLEGKIDVAMYSLVRRDLDPAG